MCVKAKFYRLQWVKSLDNVVEMCFLALHGKKCKITSNLHIFLQVGFNTAQKHYLTYAWAVPNGESNDGVCRITFGSAYLPDDSCQKYVLCYVSKVMSCVLGVSNVFRVSGLSHALFKERIDIG